MSAHSNDEEWRQSSIYAHSTEEWRGGAPSLLTPLMKSKEAELHLFPLYWSGVARSLPTLGKSEEAELHLCPLHWRVKRWNCIFAHSADEETGHMKWWKMAAERGMEWSVLDSNFHKAKTFLASLLTQFCSSDVVHPPTHTPPWSMGSFIISLKASRTTVEWPEAPCLQPGDIFQVRLFTAAIRNNLRAWNGTTHFWKRWI